METVVHEGVTFVKIAALAKKYKYTTDYIGQLCRADKVDCQLVGRAWFVSEVSLKDHQSERYKDTPPAEILSKNSTLLNTNHTNREVVRPLVSKHVQRNFESYTIPIRVSRLQSNNEVQTEYYEDTQGIDMQFESKPIASQTARIKPSLPEETTLTQRLKVRSQSTKSLNLGFTPLPEIVLRGSLKISSLDTEHEYQDSEIASFSETPINPREHLKPLAQSFSPVHFEKSEHFVSSNKSLFKPQVVTQTTSASSWSIIFIPTVIVVSLVLAVSLISISSFVVSDGFVLNQSLKFNPAEAITALNLLYKN